MAFESMIKDLLPSVTMPVTVTRSQYNIWRAGYLFDALKSLRYGQSFCNYFDITDNILYYDDRSENCHRYICQHYIEGKD